MIKDNPFLMFIPPCGFILYPFTQKNTGAKSIFLMSFVLYLYTFISFPVLYYGFQMSPFFLEAFIQVITVLNLVGLVLFNVYLAFMVHIFKYDVHAIPPLRYLAGSRLINLVS